MLGKAKSEGKVAPQLQDIWGRAVRRLVPWTVRRHRVTPADAEEFVQEGIAQLIRSSANVDTGNFETLLAAIGSRVNGIAVNARRKKAVRSVLLTRDGSFEDSDDDGAFEESLVDADVARRAVNALLERVAEDGLVFSIIGLMADEVYKPADQAKQLDCAVSEVYNARRRLNEHVDQVRKLMETW